MRTAEEWGRLAVSLPGWRWMPGMRVMHIEDGEADPVRGTYLSPGLLDGDLCIQWDDHAPRGLDCSWASPQNFRPHPWVYNYAVPDPDDPATAGCLLAMLGPGAWDNVAPGSAVAADGEGWWAWVDGQWSEGMTLGRACIAAAEALGRWPGGDE
jgi:hypothetical protein